MDERKGRAVTNTFAHAPGFVAGDRPKIVTSRFEYADSFTLERYMATGGYAGLRKSLHLPAAEVHEEVKKATVLGRGGAGFPAGTKWGLTPQQVWPRYLVVNGDESEPASVAWDGTELTMVDAQTSGDACPPRAFYNAQQGLWRTMAVDRPCGPSEYLVSSGALSSEAIVPHL